MALGIPNESPLDRLVFRRDGAVVVVVVYAENTSVLKSGLWELRTLKDEVDGQDMLLQRRAAHEQLQKQMRDMLALAAEELRARPITDGPVTLTAKVDLMLTSLQVEFVLHPETRVLHAPRSAAAAPGGPATESDAPSAPAADPSAQPPAG
mgnify:CR=1 FL=1